MELELVCLLAGGAIALAGAALGAAVALRLLLPPAPRRRAADREAEARERVERYNGG